MNVHQLKGQPLPDDAIVLVEQRGQLVEAHVELTYVIVHDGGPIEYAGSKPVPKDARLKRALVFSPP